MAEVFHTLQTDSGSERRCQRIPELLREEHFLGIMKRLEVPDHDWLESSFCWHQEARERAFIQDLISSSMDKVPQNQLCETDQYINNAISMETIVLAVNLIEAHVDGNHLPTLVDVINANHPHVTPPLTPLHLLDMYEQLLLGRFQCPEFHVYPLPDERRHHLGRSMARGVSNVAQSDLHIDADSIWSAMMAAMLHTQKHNYDKYHRYHELTLIPPLFYWEEFETCRVNASVFAALTTHPEYDLVFRGAHQAGDRYMFGVVPAEAARQEGERNNSNNSTSSSGSDRGSGRGGTVYYRPGR
jgi:hypothetical protein